MLEYKLKELTLMYNYEKKKAEEKEIQNAIKEQMLEEEKVRRELESKKKAIEKDQKHFSNEVAKMIKYIQKTDSEVEKQLYADKLKELEDFSYSSKGAYCNGCTAHCSLTVISFNDGHKFISGNRCERGAGLKKNEEIPCLYEYKYARLLSVLDEFLHLAQKLSF